MKTLVRLLGLEVAFSVCHLLRIVLIQSGLYRLGNQLKAATGRRDEASGVKLHNC
jgi:hypothetical protein